LTGNSVPKKSPIKILDEITVCKIAAGEVIIAPANVVKELVENSVDAGASEVRVEIRGSGVTLISVSDDGWGMTRDEALLALEHHATSKLREVSDLTGISTYGFRGEALPSIASISQMEIISSSGAGIAACSIKVEGGVIKNVSQAASARGTTINVRNLFYNTPVRRKFLKSEGYETAAIIETVTRYALTHPAVRFSLVSNGRIVLSTRGNCDVPAVISEIFPADIASGLIESRISDESIQCGNIRILAYLAPPHMSKPSNRYQYMFVNGRPFRNRTISHAVSEAYRRHLAPRQYPVLFLFLEIDRKLVDVNIHPTKTEVAFSCEPKLHDLVLRMIETGLRDSRAVPEGKLVSPAVREEFYPGGSGGGLEEKPSSQAETPSGVDHFQNELNLQETVFMLSRFDKTVKTFERAGGEAESPPVFRAAEKDGGRNVLAIKRIIGQAFNSFIVAEEEAGLILIDQHVAAEKVAYERILESLRARGFNSQVLLIPHVYGLNKLEYEIISCAAHLFEKYGFDIEAFSNNTVAVRAVPDFVGDGIEKELLFEIISSGLSDSAKFDEERFIRKLAATLSCKGAVKAGKILNFETAELLVSDLLKCSDPFFCPHGRPVIIRLPLSEILQKFKRSL